MDRNRPFATACQLHPRISSLSRRFQGRPSRESRSCCPQQHIDVPQPFFRFLLGCEAGLHEILSFPFAPRQHARGAAQMRNLGYQQVAAARHATFNSPFRPRIQCLLLSPARPWQHTAACRLISKANFAWWRRRRRAPRLTTPRTVQIPASRGSEAK